MAKNLNFIRRAPPKSREKSKADSTLKSSPFSSLPLTATNATTTASATTTIATTTTSFSSLLLSPSSSSSELFSSTPTSPPTFKSEIPKTNISDQEILVKTQSNITETSTIVTEITTKSTYTITPDPIATETVVTSTSTNFVPFPTHLDKNHQSPYKRSPAIPIILIMLLLFIITALFIFRRSRIIRSQKKIQLSKKCYRHSIASSSSDESTQYEKSVVEIEVMTPSLKMPKRGTIIDGIRVKRMPSTKKRRGLVDWLGFSVERARSLRRPKKVSNDTHRHHKHDQILNIVIDPGSKLDKAKEKKEKVQMKESLFVSDITHQKCHSFKGKERMVNSDTSNHRENHESSLDKHDVFFYNQSPTYSNYRPSHSIRPSFIREQWEQQNQLRGFKLGKNYGFNELE
ncbi:hypothetical protein G9A89_023464 [Geosiphon pyriformis]|nr:hypothetical protein G9A89_023464 [Geosiphon pyriformis]